MTQPDEDDPRKDKYGDSPMVQSREVASRPYTDVGQLDASWADKEVSPGHLLQFGQVAVCDACCHGNAHAVHGIGSALLCEWSGAGLLMPTHFLILSPKFYLMVTVLSQSYCVV